MKKTKKSMRPGDAPEQFTAGGYPRELMDQGAKKKKTKTKKKR